MIFKKENTPHVILSVAKNPVTFLTPRVPLSSFPRVTLNVVKGLALLFALMLNLTACTDYEGIVDDKYEEWKATTDVIPDPDWESSSSSSDVILSSSQNQQSSSSAKSSSSVAISGAKNSSSVASSSSAKYSSSVASCSSVVESSSSEFTIDVETGTMTDARDGQIYKTVTIGTQTWMAENLNYDYNVGTAQSICYGGESENCEMYGRFYSWSAAMDSAAVFTFEGYGCGGGGGGGGSRCSPSSVVRGACPEGWHLPSTKDWMTLLEIVADETLQIKGTDHSYLHYTKAATRLKDPEGWDPFGSIQGTNICKFSAKAAGAAVIPNVANSSGYFTKFWTSTYEDNHQFNVYMYYDSENVGVDYGDYRFMESVRCVKDSDAESKRSSISSFSGPDDSKYDAVAKTLIDLRDNQTYKTVTIGTQTWMAENLNYAYNESTSSLRFSSFCYNNGIDSCAKYGRLYLWSAAMDSAAVFSTAGKDCGYGSECKVSELVEVRGVCPKGWHLPSDDEWSTLFTAVGGTSTAGTKLKSTSGWNNSGNGTDAFGFSGLPAGYYGSSYGNFDNVGLNAYFWSSTEGNSYNAYGMYLNYFYEYADLSGNSKDYARSVRCLQDS